MTDRIDMAAGVGGVGGGAQTPEPRTQVYSGYLKRAPRKDWIIGELRDQFGWIIRIEGVRDPQGGGYRLTGYSGEVPPSLRQPVIDDEGTA